MDTQLYAGQNRQTNPTMLVAKSSRANLENWLTNIFLNDQIFDMILIVHLCVRFEHPELSLEGPNNNFVFFRLKIIVDVCNADGVMVVLLRFPH
jgi:hypothetical protein